MELDVNTYRTFFMMVQTKDRVYGGVYINGERVFWCVASLGRYVMTPDPCWDSPPLSMCHALLCLAASLDSAAPHTELQPQHCLQESQWLSGCSRSLCGSSGTSGGNRLFGVTVTWAKHKTENCFEKSKTVHLSNSNLPLPNVKVLLQLLVFGLDMNVIKDSRSLIIGHLPAHVFVEGLRL